MRATRWMSAGRGASVREPWSSPSQPRPSSLGSYLDDWLAHIAGRGAGQDSARLRVPDPPLRPPAPRQLPAQRALSPSPTATVRIIAFQLRVPAPGAARCRRGPSRMLDRFCVGPHRLTSRTPTPKFHSIIDPPPPTHDGEHLPTDAAAGSWARVDLTYIVSSVL
jgi:hypothetical protein